MFSKRNFLMLAAMAGVIGCADASFERMEAKALYSVAPNKAMDGAGPPSEVGTLGHSAKSAYDASAGELKVTQVAARANLKIIYNAHLEVIVKDLSAASKELKNAIAKSQGFIASDDLREQSGETRTGHWRIRVPTENFESLRESILSIGEPVKNKADSEDVTDQYFDLEGRIKNKKTEQEAIRRYLEDKKITAKLEEIVSVERELSRISGELEQLEGVMRRLQDRTALATIEVDFREIRDYVPPQAPTFNNRISAAFSNSLADMRIAAENFAVSVASAAPWLMIGIILLIPVALVARRIWRTIQRAQVAPMVDVRPDTSRAI